MIRLNGNLLGPTRFPDGTQQVWKLPESDSREAVLDWRFEREDEFFALAQFRDLFPQKTLYLRVPYLPYARQDKEIANDKTFALRTFADMLNRLQFSKVLVWDVHNPMLSAALIRNLMNIQPKAIHMKLVWDLEIRNVIFPDAGAAARYRWFDDLGISRVVYAKKRDQATGKILGLERVSGDFVQGPCLIVDDICDGGATFLGIHEAMIAEGIREQQHKLHLFVTHGIFSKGKAILENAGITLHTTNSLPKNSGAMSLPDDLLSQEGT